MSELLVNVLRGGHVESQHYGHVAVVNSKGKVLAYAGNPYATTFLRSAAKPIQALSVILSGGADRYQISNQELAIMCASHYGEPFHQKTVRGMLDKMGLTVDALLCGAPLSIKQEYAYQQLRDNQTIDTTNSDCSGKHCGFLATCLTKGYPIENYDQPGHPLQNDVIKYMSDMCEIPPDKIGLGEDGCGVPVHYMPLYNMAIAYAKISNPIGLEINIQTACDRIFAAMNSAPEMLAGTGGFCSELVRNANGKLIAKVGAEAIYCIGIKGRDLGIAVKIMDGDLHRPLNPAVMSVLEQLDVLTDDELQLLNSFRSPCILNVHGRIVGQVQPVFTLKYT